jgi:hypothetical protein
MQAALDRTQPLLPIEFGVAEKRTHDYVRHGTTNHDERGELKSLPAAWTDVVEPDLFVVVTAGRSPFRVEDLLALADLLSSLRP